MKLKNNSVIWVLACASLFAITATLVYRMRSTEQVTTVRTTGLPTSQDPRGRDWVSRELAERGWTQEQLDAKDREYHERLSAKGLTGVE